MKTAVFLMGFVFICCKFTETKAEGFVHSECRDRYLWIHVASGQTPRFEAVDGNDIHSISEQLASRCGYTISTFNMDDFTTFRASYYSCFTHNQGDEVFTFRFNVVVNDGGGRWTSQSVSAVCPGLIWTHREITCEEDYMEVNVNRETSCGDQQGEGGQVWQEAFSQAQRTASLAWQLMFLQSDGQVSSMPITEAQRRGYILTTTTHRVVFRSLYKQPHAEVMMVDGVPVEVVRVSLFFKQKLAVLMVDMSSACPVNSGSFDGARLLWDIPQVLTPLVGEGAGFESRSFSLGVESMLLDESTTASRGFSLVQRGGLVQIGVPFGAEGGYRKSLVVNNVYKEAYVIFLLYEHVFSLLYEDGSSIDTRHRMVRVLDTPLVCRPPFSLNQTISDHQVFSVYLGNIPTDVILEEVWINGKRLLMPGTPERGFSINPIVHVNGSRGYELQLPFEDAVVHGMYLGGGVVQYSIDINFTLTIVPQRDSYYHHTSITARVSNTFPPEITAQCSDGGISFSVVTPTQSLWEVGIDHEPLTAQLVAQRGYRLHNDSHRTTLEVPVFSIGYTYEEINLSNFYATFKLLLRDSKTLEVQTSTSKRCLFRTEDMIVCSADGTMTVVTTLTSTWPTVQPERTSLLDRTCRPKQTDGAQVLFEFKPHSCGTRAMVGEWYLVYENEILQDRLLIADGPNFISRDSQFKVTTRCFYPLSAVNRVSVDRMLTSVTPGFGAVFESHKDSANRLPAYGCSHQGSENTIKAPMNQVHPTPAARGVLPHPGIRPQPKHGPIPFVTIPAGRSLATPNQSPETQTQRVPEQVSSHPGHLQSQLNNQDIFFSPADSRIRLTHLSSPHFVEVRKETSAPSEVALDSFSRSPDPPVAEQLGSRSQSLSSLGNSIWHSGLTWDHKQDQDLQSLTFDLSLGTPDLTERHEDKPALSLHGSSGGGMEMANMEERLVNQPQGQSEPSPLHKVLIPQDYISNELLLPGKDEQYVSAATKHAASKNTVPGSSREPQELVNNGMMSTESSQVNQSPERTRSIERRNVRSRVEPSGPHLNQNPATQQGNSQSSDPPQHTTGPTAVISSGNHWMSRQQLERRGSNPAEEHILGPAGASHIRIRLAVGLPVTRQTPDQNPDSVTRGGASKTPDHSFTPQTVREHQTAEASAPSIGDLNPIAARAEDTDTHTGPTDPDPKIHSRLDCGRVSSQHGASVRQGIIRGKRTS